MNKLFTSTLLLASMIFAISSCGDDDYNSLTAFCLSYGVVEKPSAGNYTIRLDDGKVLYPYTSNIASHYFENDMRLFVDYTILQNADTESTYDHYVRINGAKEILTKDILLFSEEINDSLGYDPIELQEPWISNGFITFEYLFGGGDTKHMVNLVQHETLMEDGRVLLEFRHNAHKDPRNYKIQGAVAFRIEKAFPDATEPIPLRVKYKAYDKEKSFDLTYTPPK